MIKDLLNTYKSSLIEEKDLTALRLVCHNDDSLKYILLNLRVKWLEFKIRLLGGEE